jgi:hypothetical protein
MTIVKNAIVSIPDTTNFSKLLADIFLPNDTSHTLFELSCAHPQRLFSVATYHPASMWVLDELLLAYEARMADAAWEFYNAAAGTRDAASLLGRIWERQVHNFLHLRADPCPLTAISLDDQPAAAPVELAWEVPVGVPRRNFDFRSFPGFLEDAITQQTPSYLVPLDPNFPTVDAAFYEPGAPFRGLQMTRSDSHPTKLAGLMRIQSWMKLKSLASPLRPSKNNPWQLFFLVPEGVVRTFSKQPLIGSETEVRVWGKKIEQFVVELPAEKVLKTPSPRGIRPAFAGGK